jgi:hypothetical protein
VKRAAALVALAASLAACGETTHGTASVWITRDRGAHVLLVRKVPAGLTAMQGLERVAHVDTAYAGKFVEAIDGLSGSLTKQRDWFYFINGYEADVGAAAYRLHPGDVEWWDYRSWKNAVHVPVVVGAFPEPFLHGYDGRHLPAVVAGPRGKAREMLARRLHAKVMPLAGAYLSAQNVLVLVNSRAERFVASLDADRPGAAVRFVFYGDPMKLARDPTLARFRYSIR